MIIGLSGCSSTDYEPIRKHLCVLSVYQKYWLPIEEDIEDLDITNVEENYVYIERYGSSTLVIKEQNDKKFCLLKEKIRIG